MPPDRRVAAPRRGLRIDPAVYRDKVLGCWHGKNIGGTLGGPLEEKFGRHELFSVDWYPELPEGGIPNDDLELQLIWLQALQDRGPGITARDLADYWIDCVRYNFDEYGLSKANLVRGLVPPVSGWHNNWFRDCMGSPIRSEIWACVAPGAPEIAAHYAFEDSICDHGGGESVYGEVFNAVVESCAFVESDRPTLVEAGLTSIPPGSRTYQAIAAALAYYRAGVDWVDARNRIKDRFYLSLAQYSPINLGFQTIGLLYGTDFADAICKAVNCGWDTDCTGATVGAMLGIILGAQRLPEKWVAPLRDEISTNLPNGGIRHLRAPTNVHVLTDQVTALAPRILRYWNSDTEIGPESGWRERVGNNALHLPRRPIGAGTPRPTPRFQLEAGWLGAYDPSAVAWDLRTITCTVKYGEHAAIFGSVPREFGVGLRNPGAEPVLGHMRLTLPPGWKLTPEAPVAVKLEPSSSAAWHFSVTAPAAAIGDTNRLTIAVELDERPALPAVPLVLLGGFRWLVSPVGAGTVDTVTNVNENEIFSGLPRGWSERWLPGNDLVPEALFRGQSGVVYLAHFISSPVAQEVIVGVSNTRRMKLWLNGALEHQTQALTGLRPNQGNGGGDASNYKTCLLQAGVNQLLIKLERGEQPLQAHFTLGRPDRKYFKCLGHSVLGLRRTLVPWET